MEAKLVGGNVQVTLDAEETAVCTRVFTEFLAAERESWDAQLSQGTIDEDEGTEELIETVEEMLDKFTSMNDLVNPSMEDADESQ